MEEIQEVATEEKTGLQKLMEFLIPASPFILFAIAIFSFLDKKEKPTGLGMEITTFQDYYEFDYQKIQNIFHDLKDDPVLGKDFVSQFKEDDFDKLSRFLAPGGVFEPDLQVWALWALENKAFSEAIKERIRERFRRAFPSLYGPLESIKQIKISEVKAQPYYFWLKLKKKLLADGIDDLGELLARYNADKNFATKYNGCAERCPQIVETILRKYGLID